jgi:signal transduction histidine kinase
MRPPLRHRLTGAQWLRIDVAGAYAAAMPLVAGAVWFAGMSVSYRRQYDEAVAADWERRLPADRERARQAVRQERVRIAREIHDVAVPQPHGHDRAGRRRPPGRTAPG